jgi:hypothetical protein
MTSVSPFETLKNDNDNDTRWLRVEFVGGQ